MSILMETTRVSASESASQIAAKLGACKSVISVNQEYRNGEIFAIGFRIKDGAGPPVSCILPVRTHGIFLYLQGKRARINQGTDELDKAQAERIAWRQLLRWVEAQLAMIEIGMREPDEVFLPWIEGGDKDGLRLSVYQAYRNQRLLEAPQ